MVFKWEKLTTLFIKTKENDMFLVQIYVDDIIFGATNVSLCEEFSKCMHSEFEMSMVGELNFFFGLQIKQLKEETFINQAKVQHGGSQNNEDSNELIHKT